MANGVALPSVCFIPDRMRVKSSQTTEFINYYENINKVEFQDYSDFSQRAIREFRLFWRAFLDWSAPLTEGVPDPVCRGDGIEEAEFFPNLRLNYAENLLEGDDELPAVIACHAGRPAEHLSRGSLRERVRRAASGLAALGVGPADRVVAITYNDADAIVACLATAALGASFSTAAPGMGAPAILSRFGQLSPVVLVAHTEDRPGNPLRDSLAEIIAGLPSLRSLVTLGEAAPVAECGLPVHRLADLIETASPLSGWQRFPFNHPLFILFSSGTTGVPKCIVHGAGGTLLEHLKEHRLHTDLRRGERLFFQTSCAWMMWNWQLSALASKVTLVLYDGPVEEADTLWSIVAEHAVDVFGTSPAYLKLCESVGSVPANQYDLTRLRAILSTGSVLYDAQYDWVLRDVKRLPIQSISGGTDIIGCFVLGNPNLPVYRGEAQCRSLGLDVDAVGAARGEIGELVCRNPFPSRPLGFFGDTGGERFHDAYFSQNPGLWTHGDRIAFSALGTARLYGRSDGVLNVRGIRLGTAEIYAALQDVPELVEAMAVEQALPDTPAGSRMVLFVVLSPGVALTSALILRLRREIKRHASADHVPGLIIDAPELPTTHSGKLSERAATDIINGYPVRNREALRNPACLEVIAAHPALRPGTAPVVAAKSGQGTEAVLQAIWARAFGVGSIGVDEDFFALGGDSLMAVAICAEITEAFGYDLPIATLFHASTIAALARLLDGGVVWQGDSPLVLLRAGEGRPVFLLHSIDGNVFEWHALLRRLDSLGRPIEALQARGLDPAETASATVEEMAADYIGLIRARQPEGPYTLLGYSFGGLLAYEIAVRLNRLGETVDLLGLIDTNVHARTLPPLAWLSFRLGRLGQFYRRMGGRGMLSFVWQKVRCSARGQALVSHPDFSNSAGVVLPPVLQRVRLACERALDAYNPPSYPGEAVFFRSQERRIQFCDPLIVWRRRASSVRIVDVPGSHTTMLQEPNVGQLGMEIGRCLYGSFPAPRAVAPAAAQPALRDAATVG